MPVAVRNQGGVWRIVDVERGTVTRSDKGDPVDQGGGASQKRRRELETQARAINARLTVKRAQAEVKHLEAREAATIVRRRLAEKHKGKTYKGAKR